MKPEPNAAQPPQKLIIRSAVPCTSTRSPTGTELVTSELPAIRPMFQPRPSRNRPDEDQRTVIAGQHRAGRAAGEHDTRDHHGAIGTDALDEPTDPRGQPVHAGDVHRDT